MANSLPVKKINQDYMPNTHLVLVLIEKEVTNWSNGTYLVWFDNAYIRQKYINHYKDRTFGKFSLRRGVSKNPSETVFVMFDMANGDSRTKRYLWIFPSLKEALAHHRKQSAMEYGAPLSPAYAYHRLQ